MISILLSALILVGDTPAVTPAPATAVPGASVAKPKKERKVCRTPLELTGSRMRQRVCRTESEWAMRDEGRSADDLKSMGSQ